MNNVNEQILDAMSILIESNNKKLKFDKTIKCQIVDDSKAQSGEYKVKYFGDSFTAYSQDTSKRFKKNDTVYVRIPENNMDNKKFITEKVTSKNDYETSLEEIDDIKKVDLVGIAWDKIYHYSTQVCMAVNVGDEVSSREIYYNNLLNVDADKEFKKYSKDNNSFLLQGKFTTNFTEIPEKGNWGLRITFKYKTPTDGVEINYRTITYTIDHTSMTGNSYNYANSSVQYAIFSVEGKNLLGIERIELFQEGIELKNSGSICVEDLLLQFVTPIEDYSTYSVHILTKEGVYLNEREHRQITLEAQYKYKGENILTASSKSNYSIYWFREDKRVGRLSADYTKEGGIGWRKVDEDKITITIDKQDVMTSARYKLVIQYDEYWISKIIEVYYEDSIYTLDMVLNQDSNNLSVATLKVLINPTSTDYSYYWIKENIDGEVEELVNHGDSLSFDITSIYQSTTFYCTIYKGDFLLGTVSKDISTDVQSSDLEVNFIGGNTTFLYDEAGDVTLESANQEKSLSFELKWKGNKINQYTVEWIYPEESRTMLTGIKTNEDRTILYYKILTKFNAERTKNTISLIIRLSNGIEYKFDKEFIFLKQGDPGTNGTTFTTKISSTAECLISGATPLNNMRLSVTAYKDGELAQNLGYTITTYWSIPSEYKKVAQIDVDRNSGRVSVNSHFGDRNYYGNVVKAETKIEKGSSSAGNYESTTIYNYYPVIVLKYSQYRNLRITSRVKDVLYGSDGYNPNYASTTPWKVSPDIPISWTIVGNSNSEMYQKDGEWLFKAPKKYLASDKPTAVLAIYSTSDYIICPVVMTLNTYGLDWINGWDGLNIEINEKGGTILAPMVGAGEKNSANQFTGTVMGIHSLVDDKYGGTRNGLVGYNKGEAAYGFFADGTGFIGLATGGRITFDGNGGIIQSANYGKYNEGMQINLREGTIDAHNFKLTTGTIIMNSVANSNKNNVAIGINQDGNTYAFKVLHNGQLTCTGAIIKGTITAESGKIGGFRINGNILEGGSSATISGGNITSTTITASNISGGNVTATSLAVGSKISANQIGDGELPVGVIYTGSLKANQIKSGKITSEHIDTENLTVAKADVADIAATALTVDSISANKITSGTLGVGVEIKIGGTLKLTDDEIKFNNTGTIKWRSSTEGSGSVIGIDCINGIGISGGHIFIDGGNKLHLKAKEIYLDGTITGLPTS